MKRITVLLSVLVAVLLSVSVAMAVTCRECEKEGKKSRVDVQGATSTLLATQQYYDEDGGYHFDDPNTTTHNYECSRGHKFSNSKTNSSAAWVVVGVSNYWDNAIMTNVTIEATNAWLTLGAANAQDTIFSWDVDVLTFFPDGSNTVVFTTTGGQFKVVYDCEVDEASKAVLEAIEEAGRHMGYVILDKNETKLIADALIRLREWEKAADEYRALVKKLEDK